MIMSDTVACASSQRARMARKVPKGTAPDDPEPMRKKLRRWRKRKRNLRGAPGRQLIWPGKGEALELTRGR